IQPTAKLVRLDAVDFLVELERFLSGQIPPQLVLLAHDEREPATIRMVALPGDVAEDLRLSAGGKNQPGEQFERCRFAGPVGPEEGDHLAGGNLEADVLDRFDNLVVPLKE